MFGYFHFRVSQIHYVVMSLSNPVFGVKYLTPKILNYFCGFSKMKKIPFLSLMFTSLGALLFEYSTAKLWWIVLIWQRFFANFKLDN